MERRYFYARTVGTPQTVLQRIAKVVVDAGLASQIPLVKLERKSRGEFYVFLGVDGEENARIPGGLGQSLQNLGIRFEEDFSLRPDQIQSMVQRQDIEIHGFDSLQYRRRIYEDPGDPFEQSDTWQPQEAPAELCARYEQLLSWLSVRSEGVWESFAQACSLLKVAEDSQESRSAFRRLTLLGHIDCSADGSRWSVSPAALVRFPDDSGRGYLAGQRTGPFLNKVGESYSMTEVPQSCYPGPPRIALETALYRGDEGVVNLGIADAGATSSRLAELLPGLNGWKDSLQQLPGLSTAPYHIERWCGQDFQTCDTVYERDGVYHGEPGMYRLRRDGDSSSRTLTLFFDAAAQRWLRGDWYGLRFLALEAEHDGVETVYDLEKEELLVPASQRWPLLYERALTLASGLLPGRADNPNWLSYTRIPLNLARTLSHKLNVNLTEI